MGFGISAFRVPVPALWEDEMGELDEFDEMSEISPFYLR